MDITKLNIALAHDSLTQLGGAERVLEALHEIFPQAPVFVLVQDKKLKDKYKKWDIRTSWLQIFYNFLPKLQYFLPLIPLATKSLNFEGYDLIISSSSSWVKNIAFPKKTIHVDYCHTPTRFLWIDKDYVSQEAPKLLRPVLPPILNLMKKWDYRGAQRVTNFIANSAEVKKRINDVYNRSSEVIYPFIETEFWKPTKPKGTYFLLAGRLQAHKKNKLFIELFNELGLPLHVVGTGRQEDYLKTIAKPNTQFLGRITDENLRDEYSGALGFLYPQIEDFGLMPLEAAACGTATLALNQGGSLETIVPGVTGEFFTSYDRQEIKKAVLAWNYKKYSLENLQQQAKKFTKEKFKNNIINFIESLVI